MNRAISLFLKFIITASIITACHSGRNTMRGTGIEYNEQLRKEQEK